MQAEETSVTGGTGYAKPTSRLIAATRGLT
jgi:hypothetical protein